MSMMEDKEEKAKYKNHKNLLCPQEWLKYAPKKPKYSAGVGVKRRFGDCIWSKSGEERFEQAKVMWRSTVDDERKWDWLLMGWEKYASKNGLFCHFKLRESLSGQENIGSSNEEEGGGQEEVELVLEGDDDYEVGRDDKWKTTDTVELPVAISGDNAPTDQQDALQGLEEEFQQAESQSNEDEEEEAAEEEEEEEEKKEEEKSNIGSQGCAAARGRQPKMSYSTYDCSIRLF